MVLVIIKDWGLILISIIVFKVVYYCESNSDLI